MNNIPQTNIDPMLGLAVVLFLNDPIFQLQELENDPILKVQLEDDMRVAHESSNLEFSEPYSQNHQNQPLQQRHALD